MLSAVITKDKAAALMGVFSGTDDKLKMHLELFRYYMASSVDVLTVKKDVEQMK